MKLGPVELLYQTLHAEIGIVVQTPNPEKLRQKLYKARKEDEAFGNIRILISRTNPQNELWLVKGNNADEPEKTYP